jgi:hypothetical protein
MSPLPKSMSTMPRGGFPYGGRRTGAADEGDGICVGPPAMLDDDRLIDPRRIEW